MRKNLSVIFANKRNIDSLIWICMEPNGPKLYMKKVTMDQSLVREMVEDRPSTCSSKVLWAFLAFKKNIHFTSFLLKIKIKLSNLN